MRIRYCAYKDIELAKWDDAISSAANGLVYAYSVYLDHMSDHWDALIADDYAFVMPLTYRKKYGIHYLYQPFFTASLGVFGTDVNAAILEAFLKAIPKKFRYWDIYLNQQNLFPVSGYDLYERVNYVLDLSPAYELLYQSFRENIKRNIRKSVQLGCRVEKNIPVSSVIALAKEQSQQFSPATDHDYTQFEKLFHALHEKKQAVTYGIVGKDDALLASCVLFYSHNRVYYILVGNHPNGRTIGASHNLVNAFIADHAGKSLLLDFEGSDIRNLAFFYSSFGATVEKYPGLRRNTLPWPLKLLKK